MRTYLSRDFSRTLLSGLVLLSLLCSSISGQEAPSFDWKPQYGVRVATAQDGDCATKVRNGDIVFIRHRGVFVDPKTEKFIQFDGDGGEPLRFVVGEKRIITGMEVGVIGQVLSAAPCADRRRSGAAAAAARCNCAHTRPPTSRHAAARICRAQATDDGDIAACPIRWTAAHRPLPPACHLEAADRPPTTNQKPSLPAPLSTPPPARAGARRPPAAPRSGGQARLPRHGSAKA